MGSQGGVKIAARPWQKMRRTWVFRRKKDQKLLLVYEGFSEGLELPRDMKSGRLIPRRHPGNTGGTIRDRYGCRRLLRSLIGRERRPSGKTGGEAFKRIWYHFAVLNPAALSGPDGDL
jgi:hypothetical protein